MMYWWEGHGGWWMWLLMIAFWGVIVGLIIWAVISLTRRTGGENTGSRALDIGRERYARGEISQEEFEKMKRTLQ